MANESRNNTLWRRIPGPINGRKIRERVFVDGEKLIVKRIAQENISALTLVRALNKDDVVKANWDTFQNANALGVALQSVSAGQEVEVVIFGPIEDPFFNFPLNAELFLGANGVIISTDPSPNFVTHIGHSLGNGAIVLDIEVPIKNE